MKRIRYKCLILDHDDTAVKSTMSVHYPAHVETMKALRPKASCISLTGWFEKNFHPGVMEYFTGELRFTEEELEEEYRIWRKFTQTKTPSFYDGFIDFLIEYRKRGGLITVVSHSDVDIIKAHYSHHTCDGEAMPDLIFGWSNDKEKRKPSPYPVQKILQHFNLLPEEVLIIDDLRPGVQMAKSSGVDVAAAGWEHDIPLIKEYMKKECLAYFNTVEELEKFVLMTK